MKWLIRVALAVIGVLFLRDWASPHNPYSQLVGLLTLVCAVVIEWQASLAKKLEAENKKVEEANAAVKQQLLEEQFSAPKALARGYFKNFVSPAVSDLLRKKIPSALDVQFYIYIPEKLSDAKPESVGNFKSELELKGYIVGTQPAMLHGKYPRNVWSVQKKADGAMVFLDLPTTIQTLIEVVDYKIASPADSMDEPAKAELGCKYIDSFKAEIEFLLVNADDTNKERVHVISKKDFRFVKAPIGFEP